MGRKWPGSQQGTVPDDGDSRTISKQRDFSPGRLRQHAASLATGGSRKKYCTYGTEGPYTSSRLTVLRPEVCAWDWVPRGSRRALAQREATERACRYAAVSEGARVQYGAVLCMVPYGMRGLEAMRGSH